MVRHLYPTHIHSYFNLVLSCTREDYTCRILKLVDVNDTTCSSIIIQFVVFFFQVCAKVKVIGFVCLSSFKVICIQTFLSYSFLQLFSSCNSLMLYRIKLN